MCFMFKSRRTTWALAVAIIFAVLVPIAAFASAYVGNSNSGKFHYQGCKWEQKMLESNRVYYNSREEAIADGYVPCKVCRP